MADDNGTSTATDKGGESSVADAFGDAVRQIEDATQKAAQAAADCGDTEAAHRIAAAVVEAVDRSLADLATAAEAVEQVAEEVAEEAAPGPEAEAAEEAVEAAHDAGEAVEEAEAEVREEQREQGGGEVTEAVAVDQAIHQEAEEVKEELPVEAAPVVDAVEEVEQEIADAQVADVPPLIAPEPSHPYYRERKLSIFGRKIKL